MILKCIFYLILAKAVLAQKNVTETPVVYDAYFGKPITDARSDQLASLNATGVCTVSVAPCRYDEGRRVTGACVNPRYPSRGAAPTPLLRMLPAKFGPGNSLRPAMNGTELPSTRLLRTKTLADGFSEDHDFNQLASHLLVFSIGDIIELTVLISYVVVSDCCLGNTRNRVNPSCIPIPVPQDDPYLRRTGIRCMNLTRFPTYQDGGCIPNTLPAERYVMNTPLEDLSVVYGFSADREREIRTYLGGLLKTEEKNGVERPPGTSATCIKNRRPVESACYEFGNSYDGNTLTGVLLSAMWFYREHNRLARNLAKINPCWDDQKLFDTARQINIAQWQYMLYYELISDILGRKNAIESGILYETNGYVNDFDDHYKPGVFQEYTIGTRWFHTLQDGRTDLYSNKGKYQGSRTGVDDEFRSGILEVNNTEADLTQGAFRQPAAQLDDVIDPDLAERLFGELQSASDLPAIDMMRGRDVGLPPYNEYRKICGLPVAHDWEDLEDTIYPDKLEQMRRIYDDVDDIELMPAIYSERLLKNAFVGPTLFCIMATNLVHWRKADRYFFEHGDIPAALTLTQLNEVRKTSFARLLCDNGDSVDRIQPRAIHKIRKGNEVTSCKNIPGMELTEWRDPKCQGLTKPTDNKLQGNKDRSDDFNSYVLKSQETWGYYN